jgi:hypothetical protein
MKKPTRPKPKPHTHFEQVPLEQVVKKIVEKAILIREPASRKSEPYSMRADRVGV